MDQSKQPGIQIEQIILVEARFAHGKNALSLPSRTPIQEQQFQIDVKVGGKAGDRTAMLSIRAYTSEDADALYSVSVELAMVISAIPGQENLDPFAYAQQMGPSALFPFVREAVANLTLKGRFGPLWLKPVNFMAAGSPQQAVPAETAVQGD